MFPKNSRILIVDDSQPHRQVLKDLLGQLGYTSIVEAEDGNLGYNAIVKAVKNKETFDLVISDLYMKPTTGLEFLVKIRKNTEIASLPFIMATTENGVKKVLSAINEGASEYMVKPYELDTLSRKLASAWNKTHPAKKT
jgi:two-component system chemotaxis response regulator CheY